MVLLSFACEATMARTFTAVVENCPDTNLYVGHVPGFPGAHSQAKTRDELNENLREVISLLLEGGEVDIDRGWTECRR